MTNARLAPKITVASDVLNTIVLDTHPLLVTFVDVSGREHELCALLSEDGCWIEFFGSVTGSHRLSSLASITSAERVYAHWIGYVGNSVAAANRQADRLAVEAA
jgi:hypothetical protein